MAALLLESCGKYEDGPGISLRSRTNRITGIWSMSNAEVGDQNITSFYSTFDISIRDDNTYSQTTALLVGGLDNREGVWSFTDDDKIFRVEYDNAVTLLFTIRRLTNSEFWVEFEATEADLGLDGSEANLPALTNVRLEFVKVND